MDIFHYRQISFEDLTHESVNIFISTCGYQKRCTFLLDNFNLTESNKYAIVFNDFVYENISSENIHNFKKNNFILFFDEKDNITAVSRLLEEIKNFFNKKDINILIDYSCMPRKWLSMIIEFFVNNEFVSNKINIFFTYIPKKNNSVKCINKYKKVDILYNYVQKKSESSPVSLIVGLNTDSEIINDIISEIKPDEIFAFIPYFEYDSGHFLEIQKTNKKLLNKLNNKNKIIYDPLHPDDLISMLSSIVLDLRNEKRVFIFPNGPKPFTLASIIVSSQYPDVEIYDYVYYKNIVVSSDFGDPYGIPIVTKVVFIPEFANEEL